MLKYSITSNSPALKDLSIEYLAEKVYLSITRETTYFAEWPIWEWYKWMIDWLLKELFDILGNTPICFLAEG